jgi:DNA mismatch endonuclease (patch repair protein)
MADHLSPEKRSKNMAAISSKTTEPELIVRRMLFRLGYRFRLHVANLPGKPDIVFKGKRKAVFVHGCFWHRHPGCKYSSSPKTNVGFWREKFAKNISRDIKVQANLSEMGWDILIIWQCELKNADLLSKRLIEFMGSSY